MIDHDLPVGPAERPQGNAVGDDGLIVHLDAELNAVLRTQGALGHLGLIRHFPVKGLLELGADLFQPLIFLFDLGEDRVGVLRSQGHGRRGDEKGQTDKKPFFHFCYLSNSFHRFGAPLDPSALEIRKQPLHRIVLRLSSYIENASSL